MLIRLLMLFTVKELKELGCHVVKCLWHLWGSWDKLSQGCPSGICPNSTLPVCHCSKHPIGIQTTSWLISFLFLPQTSLVGITSTGVIWCPSMESATTSSTASSAASPVQIQTYNHTEQLCLCHRQIGSKTDKKKNIFDVHARKKDCFLLEACGEHWKTNDISMEVRESCCVLSSPCDAGHLDTRTWCWQHYTGMWSGQYK